MTRRESINRGDRCPKLALRGHRQCHVSDMMVKVHCTRLTEHIGPRAVMVNGVAQMGNFKPDRVKRK